MKEVADVLGLDYETVKRYHWNVQLKLGCDNDIQTRNVLGILVLN